MATTLSLSLSLNYVDPLKSHQQTQTQTLSLSKHNLKRNSLSATPKPSIVTSFFEDPFQKTKSLINEERENLKRLDLFQYSTKLKSGSVFIRALRADEFDITVNFLAESFAESMLLPNVGLLRILVKQYLIERISVLPNAAILVGFFREIGDGGEECLAGTVEVCFNELGAHVNASCPTPVALSEAAYVCNMSVGKAVRRKGIGWHLLKASEELISQMSSSREVYLHCRTTDKAPLNMYMKAGYSVVKTDSILILLTLKRRKHSMRKELPVVDKSSNSDILVCNDDFGS